MFHTQKAHKEEEVSSLTRKKELFRVQIRRQHKDRIISQLRQTALIPSSIITAANSLPHSVDQLINYLIDSTHHSQIWNRIVADKILAFLNARLKQIDQQIICAGYLVYLLNYVLVYSDVDQLKFDTLIGQYKVISTQWKLDEKQLLLKIIIKATAKYQQPQYLKLAKQIVQLQKIKLTLQSLKFYDFVMIHHPKQGFEWDILNDRLFQKLIDSLGIVFYSVEQKIKMCEILIQALYLCQKKTVSQNWQLRALFQNLAFLISYATQHKLLTERVLFLIFNINIDAGSKIFITHTCVENMIRAMKDDELPDKLRSIMAQTYLSALCNLQNIYLQKYITNHQNVFFSTIQYILTRFNEQKQLMVNAEEVLLMFLKLGEQPGTFEFKKIIEGRHQFMQTVRNIDCFAEFVQQFQMM